MGGQDELRRLLGRTALRDRAAFGALYRATSAKLFGVVLRIVPARAEAEEVLQIAYLRVWSEAGRYSGSRASPIAWMAAIARNAAIDRARANAARGGVHEPIEGDASELQDAAPSPEHAALVSIEADRLRRCMGELEERHAIAIRFAYVAGLTYREIGEALGAPENTVKTWMRRSLARLRECMGRPPPGPGGGAP